MTSPTARSLALLRKEGWQAHVVERWNQWAKIRQDFAGFIDIIAFRGDTPGIIGVQATSATNVSSRVNKIAPLPAAVEWLKAGGRLEVWGWRKAGKRGTRKTWQVRRVVLVDVSGSVQEATQ